MFATAIRFKAQYVVFLYSQNKIDGINNNIIETKHNLMLYTKHQKRISREV
jgi:hypothetical protein